MRHNKQRFTFPINFDVERDNRFYTIDGTCTAIYYEGCRGLAPAYDHGGTPDDPPDIEIVAVKAVKIRLFENREGDPIPIEDYDTLCDWLTKDQIETLEEDAMLQGAESLGAAEDAHVDAQMDERRWKDMD